MYIFSYLFSFFYDDVEERPTLTPHSMSPIPKGRFYNEAIGKYRRDIVL